MACLQVRADDADVGDNAKLVYRLLDNSANRSSEFDSSPFAVDPVSGVIRATSSVDREVKAVYRFHVTAADAGFPRSFTSTALVTVNIIDVNDEPPQFQVYFSLFRFHKRQRSVLRLLWLRWLIGLMLPVLTCEISMKSIS